MPFVCICVWGGGGGGGGRGGGVIEGVVRGTDQEANGQEANGDNLGTTPFDLLYNNDMLSVYIRIYSTRRFWWEHTYNFMIK